MIQRMWRWLMCGLEYGEGGHWWKSINHPNGTKFEGYQFQQCVHCKWYRWKKIKEKTIGQTPKKASEACGS